MAEEKLELKGAGIENGTYRVMGDMCVRLYECYHDLNSYDEMCKFGHQTFEFGLDAVGGQVSVRIKDGELVGEKPEGILHVPFMAKYEGSERAPTRGVSIYLYFSFHDGVSPQRATRRWFRLSLHDLEKVKSGEE